MSAVTFTSPAIPYPGLRPFGQEEARLFFGRQQQVNELLTRLENRPDFRFLAVIGASGSGKSSLVRAGLLPALEKGFLLDAPAEWKFVTARPGDAPLRSLAQAWLQTFRPPPDAPGADELDRSRVDVEFTLAQLRGGPLGLVRAYRGEQDAKGRAVLILIDQFEELFRFRRERDGVLGADEPSLAVAGATAGGSPHEARDGAVCSGQAHRRNEAAAFVDLLLTSARQTETPLYVVVTMRSDFLGDCDAFYGLPEAMSDKQFLTPRLTREQARQAIEGPAGLFHAEVKPALVTSILNQIGNDPDQLPLMQHALQQAWQRAREHRGKPGDGLLCLRSEDYEEVGGIPSALRNHADQIVADLLGLPAKKVLGVDPEKLRTALTSDRQRARLRTIEMLFRSLCERKAEGPMIRRIASVAEVLEVLADQPGEQESQDLVAVIEAFRAERCNFLVTTPAAPAPITRETKLDISHESLIRQWDKLKAWLADEERSARIFLRLSQTAIDHKAGDAGRYRPPELDIALKWKQEELPTAAWARRYRANFDQSVAFLDASNRDQQKRTRRMRTAFAAVTALAVVAVVAGWLANQARKEAEKHRQEAEDERKMAAELLQNQSNLYRWPTLVGGEIISGVFDGLEPEDLKNRFQRLDRKIFPFSSNPKIDDAISGLDQALSAWEPTEYGSKPAKNVQSAVIRLAKACRESWEQDSRSLSSEQKARALQLIAGSAYTRAMTVTKDLAANPKDKTLLDKFERLYWSELVFMETRKIEGYMIDFRHALFPEATDSSKPSVDLTQLAEDLRTACEAHLNLLSDRRPVPDDLVERLRPAKHDYERKDFDSAKQHFEYLFFLSLGSNKATELDNARTAAEMMAEAVRQYQLFQSDAERGKSNLSPRREAYRLLNEANNIYPYGFQQSEEVFQ